MYGTDEESYHSIYSYMHMLEQANPGTYTRVECDSNGHFNYAFVSIGVWRRAIPHLRKVRRSCPLIPLYSTCHLLPSS